MKEEKKLSHPSRRTSYATQPCHPPYPPFPSVQRVVKSAFLKLKLLIQFNQSVDLRYKIICYYHISSIKVFATLPVFTFSRGFSPSFSPPTLQRPPTQGITRAISSTEVVTASPTISCWSLIAG